MGVKNYIVTPQSGMPLLSPLPAASTGSPGTRAPAQVESCAASTTSPCFVKSLRLPIIQRLDEGKCFPSPGGWSTRFLWVDGRWMRDNCVDTVPPWHHLPIFTPYPLLLICSLPDNLRPHRSSAPPRSIVFTFLQSLLRFLSRRARDEESIYLSISPARAAIYGVVNSGGCGQSRLPTSASASASYRLGQGRPEAGAQRRGRGRG
jgi:hypothetical protein